MGALCAPFGVIRLISSVLIGARLAFNRALLMPQGCPNFVVSSEW